jgi:hypothetical protein
MGSEQPEAAGRQSKKMDAQQARQGQTNTTESARRAIESKIHWITQSIDLLASEYGWTKDDILENTFPDELADYGELIRKRKNAHYLMLLNVVSAPHADESARRELIETLSERDRDAETLDKAGMMALIQKMGALGSGVKVGDLSGEVKS